MDGRTVTAPQAQALGVFFCFLFCDASPILRAKGGPDPLGFAEINRKIDPEHVKYDVVTSYGKLMEIVGMGGASA